MMVISGFCGGQTPSILVPFHAAPPGSVDSDGANSDEEKDNADAPTDNIKVVTDGFNAIPEGSIGLGNVLDKG